jgi:hypothetical protein
MSLNSKRCWEPKCTNKGIKCLIPGGLIDDEDQMARYCHEHAAKNGYCYSCGIFCAGIESFDFGKYPGLCDNCADEVKANEALEEYDEGIEEVWPFPDEFPSTSFPKTLSPSSETEAEAFYFGINDEV